MKARQFVNAVVGYSLGRIKLKNNLFFPSTAEAQQQAAAMAAANVQKMEEDKQAATTMQEEDYDDLPLRVPKLSFVPSSRKPNTDIRFLPFYGTRGGEGKFLCVDESGNAALYDADACTVELMPGIDTDKTYSPISWSVTHGDAVYPARPDALYAMDSDGGSFKALVYGDPGRHQYLRTFGGGDEYAWHWRTLPAPPVEHTTSRCYGLLPNSQEDAAGATICVSFSPHDDEGWGPAGSRGTYCFDTGSHEWSKAGDWTLPFGDGCSAPHAPELGQDLLFGIESNHPYRFCAMDISGMKMNRAPVLRHAWLEHADPPPDWWHDKDDLVYLGAGRFCIHRSFNIMAECGYGDWETVDTVVMLTGVEVVRAPGSSRLRMVKHKSKLLDCHIESLL